MYSLEFSNGAQKSVLKGISRHVTENQIRLKDYKDVLTTSLPQKHSMTVIRSIHHQLYIQKIHKTSLSNWDDKRYALNSIETIPYGMDAP